MERILVIGALGQLGTELVPELKRIYGNNHIYITDIHPPHNAEDSYNFVALNVMDKKALGSVIRKYKISQIYHLAALLSAKAEKTPITAWDVNMQGLLNVLEAAKEFKLKKVYWPSSIGVFGKDTPKINTPQYTVMNPTTVYGISKLAGERWCAYYFEHHGVDVRSLRYPGLIGYKSLPGGGTTDYAVEIYHKALEMGKYECFLKADTFLPMMYMPDAVRATIELMEARRDQLRIKSSYNLSGISFCPAEIAGEIKKHIPLKISYKPDFRQEIADSWPQSIDDTFAREDWHWQNKYDLTTMTKDILSHLEVKKLINQD